ncbi:MAG: YIP1 family protein [Desulfobaccales bacterium]
MELEEGWGAEAAVAEPDSTLPVPWEDPGLSGMVGFFRTLRDVLFHPQEFFGNLGREGWAEPLAFALIVSSAGLLCALFWHLLALAPAGLNPEDAAGLSPALGLGPGALVAMMAGAPLLVLVNLGVGGLCWWGSVALVGAGRDFIPTWRIFCYAQGGMALAFIPFFGMFVAGIWVLVLMYHGVKQVYGLSAWGSLGALAAFLSLQALLAMTLLLGLAAGLAFLGCLLLLG